ncbi:hypothetical protein K1T35_47080 [Pseudonocardia sp. DSM 110487]|uniref:hypothetical protein n=1 Tax=Pseudonocardia sp. DSM 110487 TaxID=2865833 RepID=UPI001C6950DE|nr:hypothetical protein [Pseudonocardia sp. DSM 110487]QYN35756.1 hypothetical protein K1T35_47080 [Pseudonocardia sp. DSM 110487]
MSELVTDLDWWAATRYPSADEEWGPVSGRHAHNEDAELTPIFHALTRGGWRSRQHEPAYEADPADEFDSEPLTAPIPSVPPRSRRELPETGRHRRVR